MAKPHYESCEALPAEDVPPPHPRHIYVPLWWLWVCVPRWPFQTRLSPPAGRAGGPITAPPAGVTSPLKPHSLSASVPARKSSKHRLVSAKYSDNWQIHEIKQTIFTRSFLGTCMFKSQSNYLQEHSLDMSSYESARARRVINHILEYQDNEPGIEIRRPAPVSSTHSHEQSGTKFSLSVPRCQHFCLFVSIVAFKHLRS